MQDSRHDASASIGACEFHKKTGITDKLRQAEDLFKKKFTDSVTGKIREEYVRKRNCPLCGEDDNKSVFAKNGFDHVRCRCGMIYVSDVLKEEYLNIVYADNDFEEDTHNSFRTEPRKSFIEAIYDEGLGLLKKLGTTSGLLLDVGCSSGLFMEFAQQRGFVVKGIEPSHYAVEFAKKHGLDAIQGYFKRGFVDDGSVDVITLWDVLEHCENPQEILEDAKIALKSGGIIFIQVPNVMGLAPRVMRQDCNMFTGFGHINLFGPDTLRKIMEESGFVEIEMQSVISEISVINNYLNYHDPYYGPSTERENVLGIIDIESIHRNLMGYKLQAVGRKI